VFDYGIALKQHNGKLVLRRLVAVMHLLFVVKGNRQSPYLKSLMFSLLVLVYECDLKLPSWQMFRHNFQVYNEEAGEMSFGLLARCVLGDTLQSKFDHLNDMYTLIHTYRSIDADVRADASDNAPREAWRKHVETGSEELDATIAWLKALLRRIKHNDLKVYNDAGKDGVGKKKTQFKSASWAAANMILRKKEGPMWTQDTPCIDIAPMMEACKATFFHTEWGWRIKDVWPELTPIVNPNLPRLPLAEMPEEEASDLELDPAVANDQEIVAAESGEEEMEEEGDEEYNGMEEARMLACINNNSRDIDARGESVSWKQWGAGLSTANITTESRTERRVRSRRVGDAAFPMVNPDTFRWDLVDHSKRRKK
jgi:hypothetical protein